jgi:predicted nucleic acid-binding protein
MTRTPQAFVLDAWSVMAYLDDEPAGEKVADIIAGAHEQRIPMMMTVINVGEVWYIIAREISAAEAEKAVEELRHLGIRFIDADWDLSREAAEFKAGCKMSFADCFTAALAKRHQAQLVTGDPEFRQVEAVVPIMWVT